MTKLVVFRVLHKKLSVFIIIFKGVIFVLHNYNFIYLVALLPYGH